MQPNSIPTKIAVAPVADTVVADTVAAESFAGLADSANCLKLCLIF